MLYHHDKSCCDERNPHLGEITPTVVYNPHDSIPSYGKTEESGSDNSIVSLENDDKQGKRLSVEQLMDESIIKRSGLGIEYRRCMFEKKRVLVIEECSNIYTELISKLLIHMICCGNLCKIIIVGNKDQMPSIRCGNVIRELFKSLNAMGCAVEFKHNHRVDKESEILKDNADAVRFTMPNQLVFDKKICIHIPYYVPKYASREEKDSNIKQSITNMLQSLQLSEYNHHIITRTNDVRKKVQEAVEQYYHQLSHGKGDIKYHSHTYWVGRKYMFKQNNHELGISTNRVMILTDIEDTKVVYYRNGSKKVEVDKQINTSPRVKDDYVRYLHFVPLDKYGASDAKEHTKRVPWTDWAKAWLTRASCTTVSSFQGGQIHTVILFQPFFSKHDTTETTYTAFTRPTNRMIYMGAMQNLHESIYNPEPPRRSAISIYLDECLKKFVNAFAPIDFSYSNELMKIESESTINDAKDDCVIIEPSKSVIDVQENQLECKKQKKDKLDKKSKKDKKEKKEKKKRSTRDPVSGKKSLVL